MLFYLDLYLEEAVQAIYGSSPGLRPKVQAVADSVAPGGFGQHRFSQGEIFRVGHFEIA